MKDLVNGTEMRSFIGTLNLPQPGSNRGYSPVDIIESFLVSIRIGASRSYGSKFGFTHSGWLRYDRVLQQTRMSAYAYLVGNRFHPKVSIAVFFINSMGGVMMRCFLYCRDGF